MPESLAAQAQAVSRSDARSSDEPTRLLLDTNMWSRLADRREQDDFHRFVRNAGIRIVVAPATLLELLRTSDPRRRRRAVRLLCRSSWHRLPTEAQGICGEVVAEVSRLRPSWLLPTPNIPRIIHLERFWNTQVWHAARDDDPRLRAADAIHAQTARNMVLREQQEQQAIWRRDGFLRSLEEVGQELRGARVSLNSAREAEEIQRGWRPDEPVEPWRAENMDIFWHALCVVSPRGGVTGEDTTLADWVGAYVDLDTLRRDRLSFGRFWLYEVEASNMRRCWLQSAVRFAQHASRLGSGNPVDQQHAPYLIDADVFATGDRRLARILDVVRTVAPNPCAAPVFVHITTATPSVTGAIARGIDEVCG